MPDISVLFAPDDEKLSAKIASALEEQGHSPRSIVSREYSGDLMLDEDPAIVIWSNAALRLVRLHQQARAALERGALIPVAVGGAPSPRGFEKVPAVDLSGWSGDANDPRWRFVLEEINLAANRQKLEDRDVWAQTESPLENEADSDEPSLAAASLEEQPGSESISAIRKQMGSPAPRRKKRVFSGVFWPDRQYSPARVVIAGAGALAATSVLAILAAPIFLKAGYETARNGAAVAGPFGGEAPAPPDLRTDPLELAMLQPLEAQEETSADEPDVSQASTEILSEGVSGDEIAAAELAPEISASETPAKETASTDDMTAEVTPQAAEEAPVLVEPEAEAAAQDEDELGDLMASLVEDPAPLPVEILEANYRGQYFRDCLDCPDMAELPTGRFIMGAPADELGRIAAEGPQVLVIFDQPFAIGVREVTFKEWDACVADGGCRAYQPADEGWGRGDRPVINVSLEDAKAYAAWLSAKTGLAYRLPTEAEWEYAARAGTQTPFAFGGALQPHDANYNAEHAYEGAAGPFRARTTPVASYPPNEFGLYDMHGNVWEWTSDCWVGSHADAVIGAGACVAHVMKGGAWNAGGWRLRSAHRISKSASARENDNGFRVARDMF